MMRSALHPTLEVTLHKDGDSVRLLLDGDLDRNNASALTAAVIRSAPLPADRLVLDLDGLTFIDAGGLRALADVARRARRQGRTLQLDNPSDHVVRVLRLTGLDHVLEVVR
jgi:anti-sigma B factor antagonist